MSIYPKKKNNQPLGRFYCSCFLCGVFFLLWSHILKSYYMLFFNDNSISVQQYKYFTGVLLFSVPTGPHDREDVLSNHDNVHPSQEPNAFCLSLTKTINQKKEKHCYASIHFLDPFILVVETTVISFNKQ